MSRGFLFEPDQIFTYMPRNFVLVPYHPIFGQRTDDTNNWLMHVIKIHQPQSPLL